jgi:hypothetical protein
MTSCSEFELLISQKLDHELTEMEEDLLTTHLHTCANCRTLYQDLAYLQKTLSSFSVSPPSSLHARIMDQIKEETAVTASVSSIPIRKSIFPKCFAAAAALLLLISGTVLSLRMSPFSSDGTTLENGEAYSVSNKAEPNSLAPEAKPQPEVASPKSSIPSSEEKSTVPKDVAKQGAMQKSLPKESTIARSQETVDSNAPPISDNLTGSGGSLSSSPPAASQETTSEQTSDTRAMSLLPEGITYEEAEALLLEFLITEGCPSPQVVYQGLSSDGASYLFLYTDDAGEAWIYSVAKADGAILCESNSETSVR